jgi:hypothetical protein
MTCIYIINGHIMESIWQILHIVYVLKCVS